MMKKHSVKMKRLMKSAKIKKLLDEVGHKTGSMVEMMLVLVRALEERDDATRGHSERVSQIAAMIGKKMGFTKPQLAGLERGSLLHDIGKIGIRDDLLYKAGDLSPEERAKINQHPEKGHMIILNCHLLWDLIPMIRNHHENFDGSGYPDHLRGKEIPLEARIVSIADYYDALTTPRPYKGKPHTHDEAMIKIQAQSGIKFDPEVVRVFLAVIPHYLSRADQKRKSR